MIIRPLDFVGVGSYFAWTVQAYSSKQNLKIKHPISFIDGLSLVESHLVYILQQNYDHNHDHVTTMIIFKPTYRPLKNPLAQAT